MSFWREADVAGKFPKLRKLIEEKYNRQKDDKYSRSEELFVEVLARSMNLGEFSAIDTVLDAILD